jgi:nucleoside-diphosphate-sugar epimerase
MQRPQRILLTGHQGYIGAVMGPYLQTCGYEVVGLDTGYFNECTLVPDTYTFPTIRRDVRNLMPEDVRGFDAIIHLAALSNDPIGNMVESWTEDINHKASVTLAELAIEAGVSRFLFSSSCIMYGLSSTNVVDETSPLAPQTEYARSKVKTEMALKEMATDNFSPTCLRNGTIYGVSPHMRFDTVLNSLVGAAFTSGVVVVQSDGKPWRPVLHVSDVARSFENVLRAPLEDVHNQAFNNGADHLNHQVIDLANIAVSTVPGSTLEVRADAGADQRTYKASFAKYAKTFPDFVWKFDAHAGAKELAETFTKIGLTAEDFSGASFTRLKWLQRLLDAKVLDGDLRWTNEMAEASK